MAMRVHAILAIRLKLNYGETSLIFTGCGLVSVGSWLPSEKFKMMRWKKKEFENLGVLL